MRLAILKETAEQERRVAATPDMVKKYLADGHTVVVQSGAGAAASYHDSSYTAAGASIAASASDTVKDAQIVLKVQRPNESELALLPSGSVLIGMLAPYQNPPAVYAQKNLSSFSMELLPRITRAQTMDVLSSQANLAGYRAVLEAAFEYGRALPMMMTAAGTVPPAKVLVLGAGVAGLQAIATAKRLGAVVSAFDVRAAVKEQVQSLGAQFIEVEASMDAETKGGYAKEMSEDYKRKQSEKITEQLKKHDIVIATAQIPGKTAPRLVTAAQLAEMKAGSVCLDLAVDSGGNIEGSQAGKIVLTPQGVKIIGYLNIPSRLAETSSALYARNLYNFVQLLIDKTSKQLVIKTDDELISNTLLTHNGQVVHPAFKTSAAA